MSERGKNKTTSYGYVGEWQDGTLGWCLPERLTGFGRKQPEKCAAHLWNTGKPSYLCKITVERVPNVRMRRIK